MKLLLGLLLVAAGLAMIGFGLWPLAKRLLRRIREN